MINHADIQALVLHRPFDELEAAHLAKALNRALDPDGAELDEHFTASALVLDHAGERAFVARQARPLASTRRPRGIERFLFF
jgi:hypothetical protein